MNTFLTYTFLFFIGSVGGWVVELLFRRFFSSHKWINPGFLTGPCLPLYGFGLACLYFLANLDYSFISSNQNVQVVVLLIVCMVSMTLIEYIAGLIFIKGMHIRLWDYSKRPGNIQGIICPLFTLIWGAVGVAYYFLLNPVMLNYLDWLFNNLAYTFFVGVFYGILIIDFANSMDLATKMRKFAKENKVIIGYENFKEQIKDKMAELKESSNFIFPFKSVLNMKESFDLYLTNIKAKSTSLKERVQAYNKKNNEEFKDKINNTENKDSK
ncbi:MAG: putative ABC transporter permease [Bacilli bacterium]|jgi:uncharacterized membrane protein|nr:putative ABC transporter permease [Bacilli bacterium]MDD3422476.1 putative ABC transporter permease [Bacilli bacterium]MDD4066073.1 putative ABC transporter permease [Bacilli bacterium]